MSQVFTPSIQHIGHLSGVGDAHVFGLARHIVDDDRADLIYLNMAGPVTSVESVWARLAEGSTATFRGADHPLTRHLRHRGQDDGSPFIRYQRRLPGLAIDHMVLLDRRFIDVTYSEIGTTFLFDAPSLSAKLCEHIRQLVNLPVFPEWAERLAEIGRLTRLLKPVECTGPQQIYQLNLDRSRWEQQIALRVERGELPWPGSDTPPEALSDIPSSNAESAEDQSDEEKMLRTGETFTYKGKPYRLDKVKARPGSPGEIVATDLTTTVPVGRIIPNIAAFEAETRLRVRRSPQNGKTAIPQPEEHSPSSSLVSNAEIAFTMTHEGDWTWLTFDATPPEDIREAIKRKGFRWGRRRKAWYARQIIDQTQIETIIHQGGTLWPD